VAKAPRTCGPSGERQVAHRPGGPASRCTSIPSPSRRTLLTRRVGLPACTSSALTVSSRRSAPASPLAATANRTGLRGPSATGWPVSALDGSSRLISELLAKATWHLNKRRGHRDCLQRGPRRQSTHRSRPVRARACCAAARRSWFIGLFSGPSLLSPFGLVGLSSLPHFPDAVCRGSQHGQAAEGNTSASSCTGQRQQVGEDQHCAQADGANAKEDGGGGRRGWRRPCRPPKARAPARQPGGAGPIRIRRRTRSAPEVSREGQAQAPPAAPRRRRGSRCLRR
jgi:hypothetical protein